MRRWLAAVPWLAVRAVLLAGLCACNDRPPEPAWSRPESVPANLGSSIPTPARNPLTAAGVELGRRLFFDPRLSGDNTISCATCHDPTRAFTDGRRFSVGASSTELRRNTPSLTNLAWTGSQASTAGLFWDGGAKNLESQVFAPLTGADEMAQDPGELMAELAADPDYPALFAAAFKDGLTLSNLARALAQYQRTLIAASSRYDRWARGEPDGQLSDRELRGLSLFRRDCAGCHVPDFFTDHGYHNNGLDMVFPDDHERIAWGRARITHDLRDLGSYKTPSLRNVAVTAPYMHDGRLATLEQVLEHYRSGVESSPSLDRRLIGPDGALGIPLDDGEAAAIIAFLRTLTDQRYCRPTAPAASDPCTR